MGLFQRRGSGVTREAGGLPEQLTNSSAAATAAADRVTLAKTGTLREQKIIFVIVIGRCVKMHSPTIRIQVNQCVYSPASDLLLCGLGGRGGERRRNSVGSLSPPFAVR
jgi:hypothetical protein